MGDFVWRGRAPLRLGIAGGGTDLSPYCDDYGGAVLNVAINRFAHAVVAPRTDGKVVFVAKDLAAQETMDAAPSLPLSSGLALHRALYNHFVRATNDGAPLPLTLTTSVDCPRGSGLGASSALVVSMIEAFRAWRGVAMTPAEVAHLAFQIERRDVGLAGGRQDQYAAAFGGMNFMEFASRDRVIVNRMDLPRDFLMELESTVLLCFTGVSRFSSTIIDAQVDGLKKDDGRKLEATHALKRNALEMKSALLHGELDRVAEIVSAGWVAKKATAAGISTARIDAIYERAVRAGAMGGKVSGAGGGGFMMLLVDPTRVTDVATALREMDCDVSNCTFAEHGSAGWRARPALDAAVVHARAAEAMGRPHREAAV